MNQNEAKLKLVESESELKVGGAIVIKPCGWCGREEVYNIIGLSRKGEEKAIRPDGITVTLSNALWVEIFPHKYCYDPRFLNNKGFYIDTCIAEKRLFKIIDEAPQEADDVVVKAKLPKALTRSIR